MATIGDLVLVHIKNQPTFFARIEDINADVKPDWYQVRLLVLKVPLDEITWILRGEYINGDEFKMQGHSVRMELVEAPVAAGDGPGEAQNEDRSGDKESGSNVVSLFDRKK
ncbi:MAG: hypothetical protein ACLFOY_15305 [Desulfatibacillaceae bacterium]